MKSNHQLCRAGNILQPRPKALDFLNVNPNRDSDIQKGHGMGQLTFSQRPVAALPAMKGSDPIDGSTLRVIVNPAQYSGSVFHMSTVSHPHG